MNADLSMPRHYSRFEDLQGIVIASAQAALGIFLLRAAGLITGGTAGTALVLSYLMDWNFSLTFFVLNIPFFAFAWMARGPVFFCKNIATVTAVSLMTEAMKPFLVMQTIHPAVAALIFGISAGVGLLGLFRHASSLGGSSIVALILQDRYGIKAGYSQLVHDGILFLIAAFLFPAPMVLWSLLGTVILNLVVAFNHRRDWYVVS